MMMIHASFTISDDESFTIYQSVERDGRVYLREAVMDADGNVLSEELTPVENVRLAHLNCDE
jgi:hypothetical protein